MAETLVTETCFQCGKSDDHPKVQIVRSANGEEVEIYHNDCLPAAYRSSVGGFFPEAEKLTASGLRGDDLRTELLKGI